MLEKSRDILREWMVATYRGSAQNLKNLKDPQLEQDAIGKKLSIDTTEIKFLGVPSTVAVLWLPELV